MRLSVSGIPLPPPREPAPPGGATREHWVVLGSLNGTWNLERHPELESEGFGAPGLPCVWRTALPVAAVHYERYRLSGFPAKEEILEEATCQVWHYITFGSYLSVDGLGAGWMLGHHQDESNLDGCDYTPPGPPFPPGTANLGGDLVGLERCSPLDITTITTGFGGGPGGGVNWAPGVSVTWRVETFQ